MAFAAAFVALRLHAHSVIGITLKAVTIGLLLAGPVLGEGFICVLLAAPVFYAVGLLIAVAIEAVRPVVRTPRHSRTLGPLVLPMLALGLGSGAAALAVA